MKSYSSSPLRRSRIAKVTFGAIGLGASLAIWGTLIERTQWKLRKVSIQVLKPGAAPIRVLHISDLHMAPWQIKKQRWVAGLASLKPDLVVNTGDNLGHERGLEGIRRAFSEFQGISGVFVHGSNDYWGPTPRNPFMYFRGPSTIKHDTPRLDTDALEEFWAELGWQNLNNTALELSVKNEPESRITILGVNDPHKQLDELTRMRTALTAIESAHHADGPSWAESILRLGVTHAPYRRVLDAMTELGADLILAGHTHGGQVRLPGLGALVTNCDIPRKYTRGLHLWLYKKRASLLNVSAGLGTSIYAPIRLACPPEATLIELIARE